MKVIFLDIDGVLNGHEFCEHAKSCGINPECVCEFNRIIAATDAKIVLSSAWRYMVHGGALTLKGFEYMLRTHGVTEKAEIIGLTVRDEVIPDRRDQINSWLKEHPEVTTWIVLDDMHLGFNGRHVRTRENRGICPIDAALAIELLSDDEPESAV